MASTISRSEWRTESEAALYEPWVRMALASPAWSEEKVARAERLRETALHLGEVAEQMRCSVFEVQAELRIGRLRDVRAYRRIRGLDQGGGAAALS